MSKRTDCDGVCYDCPNKWTTTFCGNEDEKYNVIMRSIKRAMEEHSNKKFWIAVDWEEKDEVAMRAWKRAEAWLNENGYTCSNITYRSWIMHSVEGKPVLDCGRSHGTAYIRKSERS